jgi:hypothetical protein
MKEMEKLLKAVADGLKSMAHGIETLSEKVSEIARQQSGQPEPPQPQKKTAAAKKTAKGRPKKPAARKPSRKPARRKTVEGQAAGKTIDQVMEAIRNAPDGIDSAGLMEKTGYDRKKVANILFKLKKQGKIKNVNRGVYTVS